MTMQAVNRNRHNKPEQEPRTRPIRQSAGRKDSTYRNKKPQGFRQEQPRQSHLRSEMEQDRRTGRVSITRKRLAGSSTMRARGKIREAESSLFGEDR